LEKSAAAASDALSASAVMMILIFINGFENW
jgi:hypothetical protein